MRRRWRHDAPASPAFAHQALTNALGEIAVLMADRMQHESLTGNGLFRQEGLHDGIEIVRGYLCDNEFGIALEHLCYLVEEARLPISLETYMALAAAGSALQMHPGYWSELRPGVLLAPA